MYISEVFFKNDYYRINFVLDLMKIGFLELIVYLLINIFYKFINYLFDNNITWIFKLCFIYIKIIWKLKYPIVYLNWLSRWTYLKNYFDFNYLQKEKI